ncbi:unnamed protein product [Cladocopium goreaui]|uniref:Guanine nucleotide-binding protein G(I)/G(S)/G(T) subunit beta-1 (Transducin beta chain 1) n=1 Tax=Cladocopium goreaui TaxID=2562237 RepID=A0A9P1GI51_9DINO|nr:unnamed protein product [Cladocopium goreaui]
MDHLLLREGWTMNVYAAVDGGHICCMTALPTDRVVTLRQKLVHTLGMVRRFRLLAGCCVLSGNMTLEEAGLCDGCSLQLVWLPEDVFATASTDTTAAFWSLETGERVQLFEGHEDQVMWLCFSPDGQLLALGPSDSGFSDPVPWIPFWCLQGFNGTGILRPLPRRTARPKFGVQTVGNVTWSQLQ